MNSLKLIVAGLLGSALIGCSSEPLVAPVEQNKEVFVAAELASSSLKQAQVCCKSFDQLPYVDIKIGKIFSTISKNNPVFEFPEGMSFFAAYRLPEHSGDIRIYAASQIDNTVLYPKIIMLDSQFRVTRVIGDDLFSYKPAALLQLDRIEATFTVDRSRVGNPNNETYMIVYTPANKLGETTTILHPAKAFARAHSTVEPNVKDPVITHSAWGLVELQLEDISTYAGKENVYVPEYGDKIKLANDGVYVDVNKKPVVAPNKLVVAPAADVATGAAVVATTSAVVATAASDSSVTASSAAMLPETETFYNQQIQKAVASGNIEKAMALTNEAERAGSRTAKQTFVNAIKSTQK